MIASDQDFQNADFMKNGRYFRVVDEDKMIIVLDKINSGNYAFQK